MIESAVRKALAGSLEETLEKMFFVSCAEIREAGLPAGAANPRGEIAVRQEFEGAASGRFTLRMPSPAAASLAADFLGEEAAELSEPRIGAVACELSNMICGSALSRLDSGGEFRLAAPTLAGDAEPEPGPNAVTLAAETDRGRLTVSLELAHPDGPGARRRG